MIPELRRLTPLLLCGAAAAGIGTLATWCLLGRPSPGIDDAYITLVYGRNLALGHGYVYTPGFEHVEGSTSPLWTLVAAAAAGVSAHPETLLLCASIAATAVAIAAFVLTVDRLVALRAPQKRRAAIVLSMLWVIAQPDFFAWNALTLMDSAIWSMLVASAALLLSSDATRERLPDSGVSPLIIFSAMALARPESLALVPSILAVAALALPRPWSFRAVLRRYGPGVVAFALVEAGLTLSRIAYFGYPLPNTYYVKAPAAPLYALWKGLGYLAWFARERPWAVPLLGLTMLTFVKLVRAVIRPRGLSSSYERGLFVVAGTVVVGLALPLPTGGDGFGAFRLLQPFVLFFSVPAIPLLLATERVESVWHRSRGARLATCALLAVGLVGVAHRFRADNLLSGEFAAAREGQRAGAVLGKEAARYAPATTVGVIAAGGVAWTYPGRVMDLLGLNWTRMAHAAGPREGTRHGHGAFQADVFWSEPPDILVLDMGSATKPVAREEELRTDFVTEVLKGLPDSPRFAEAFVPGCLSDGALLVSGYFSRAWLARVQPRAYSPLPCPAP